MRRKLKICLIDDDTVFGELLMAVAEELSVEMDYYESLEDLGRVARLASYDLLICDFFLEQFTGGEIADYVKAFFSKIPVVIVSSNEHVQSTREAWPQCVKGFLPKQIGPLRLIEEAIELSGVESEHPVGSAPEFTGRGEDNDRRKITG